jgi:hypothetical protein
MIENLRNYSEISTIQGIVYIFQSGQSIIGRLFWILVVVLMTSLATYWSLQAYWEWEEFPVLTSLKTPALAVKEIEFPGENDYNGDTLCY